MKEINKKEVKQIIFKYNKITYMYIKEFGSKVA